MQKVIKQAEACIKCLELSAFLLGMVESYLLKNRRTKYASAISTRKKQIICASIKLMETPIIAWSEYNKRKTPCNKLKLNP